MTSFRIAIVALALAALAGCVSNTTPVPPCCYAGEVATMRLAAVEIRTDDGRVLPFMDAFPGYAPVQGVFAPPLPFNEVQPYQVTFATLEALLPLYDANGDGRLEQPEVLVLYAREAARATGTAVKHFGGSSPIWALSAPNADVGGLVNWVQAHRAGMNPEGQAIFRDLERLGLDLRNRGSEGGDKPTGVKIP